MRNFKIGDLFKIENGIRLTKANMIKGTVNFLGAISTNNGIREKIEIENVRSPNCLTVNYNGSVGEAFYQSEPFFASDDVKVYYAKESWIMTPLNALYFATAIKKVGKLFSYSQKWATEKMLNSYITLPSTKNGDPDFKFMETYISAQEKLVIKNLVEWKNKVIATTKRFVRE